MNTQLIKATRAPNIGEAAIVMAVGIFVDRIQSLPEFDKNNVQELIKGLDNAKDAEEVDSIRSAIIEILEQQPAQLVPFSIVAPQTRNQKLQKWIEYVSDRIRQLRKQAGMTQEQLAQASGLPQSHLSRLERGEHSPSRATLERIAKALKKPLSAFDPAE